MKHRIAKPAEPIMRYFTPELFVRFNSSNDEEADRANEDWEEALSKYRQDSERLADIMPPQVKKLAELCLHDAEFLSCEHAFERPPSAIAVVSVKHGDQVSNLIYRLRGSIRECPPPEFWPFSKEHVHWLYDEIDGTPGRPADFRHRVLLSDGRQFEIPFAAVFVQHLPLSSPEDGRKVRRTA